MFNPNSVRPIGTKKFEEHVLDVMTSCFYENQIPGESQPETPQGGKLLWKSVPEPDPYDNLLIAVIATAVMDYVEAYARREDAKQRGDIKNETLWNSRCVELENEFFHEYDLTESVFEMVLATVKEPDGLLDMLRNGMRRYNRFMQDMCWRSQSSCNPR